MTRLFSTSANRQREQRGLTSTARASRGTGGRRLWRTLSLLVMQPGRLTTLWLRGIRARFLPPITLYLLAGILFLAVFKFLTDGPRVQLDLLDFNIIVRPPATACTHTAFAACGWIARVVAMSGPRWGESAWETFAHRLLTDIPFAAFLALPIFAVVVAQFHRDRLRAFSAHLVFAAHLHAFWFLLAAPMLFLPNASAFAAAVISPGYALCAIHEVYGGHWFRSAFRALGIALTHLVVLLVLAAAISSVR